MSSRKLSHGVNVAMIAVTVAGQGYIVAQASSPAMPAPLGGPAAIAPKPATPKPISINLDKAMPLKIPTPKKELRTTPFKNERLSGWIIKLPGDRPIATPAYYKGKLYVGGGYGSHEFYAFNAQTGALAWKYNTSDDGPTAAVCEDGCVAFNTESCTVFVLDAETGKVKWQEWLGDPLMSQPAISKGKLYIAYPGGQRGKGKSGHRLLCANLQTGKHIWDQSITADVISAPIIEGDKVFLTCMDGTSFSMDAATGKLNWKKANSGTSAPVVAKGQFVVAKRAAAAGKAIEGIQVMDAMHGAEQKQRFLAASPAPYLQGATNGTIGPQKGDAKGWFGNLDASVGFGGGAPGDAQMGKVARNLNIKSVAGAWGYQGAKSFFKKGQLYNSQRTMINSVNPESGKVNWQAEAKGKVVTGETQVFSPPSLGKTKMYLCSGDGHLVTMNQSDGKVADIFATNHPISFQPALAEGNVYIGTSNGMLVCLKTGDGDAVDWTAWGGNSAHNKQD